MHISNDQITWVNYPRGSILLVEYSWDTELVIKQPDAKLIIEVDGLCDSEWHFVEA